MSLNDLSSFVEGQKAAIANAPSAFTPNSNTYWDAFRSRLWGRGEESFQEMKPVKRDEVDPIADVKLPCHHLVATVPPYPLDLFNMRSNKLLVRSEYIEAEQAAVVSCGTDVAVFVIGGMPGTGKTAFMIWLLMRRLALRLPTVVHFQKSKALLFDDRGVWELSALDDLAPYQPLRVRSPNTPSQRIWALVDLDLEEPGWIFQRAPFFIVNAVSPHSEHLRWLEKCDTEYFYMNPWSDSEVLQVRPFLTKQPTEREIWYLHNEFGASLRNISYLANDPLEYEHRLFIKTRQINADQLPHVFWEPGSYPLSHFIITIRPDPKNRAWELREVASHRVFEMLWEEHVKNRLDLMSMLYDLFSHNTVTATSAGWVFEFRMHQLLTKQRTIHLLRMRGHAAHVNCIYEAPTTPGPVALRLAASTEVSLEEVESAGTQLEPNKYYRPKSTTFPAIDSLLLISPPSRGSTHILLMLQITCNRREHDVSLTGLERIAQLKLPPNTRKYFVVVTPENIHPKIKVPLEYTEDAGTGGLTCDESFPVFHFPLNTEELFVE